MEEKIVKMEEFKEEARKREEKQAFEKKLNDTVTWIKGNEQSLIIIGPIVIGIASGLLKFAISIIKRILINNRIRKEQYYKNTHYYDHSAGHWWELRRELTNKEWQHFQLRKEAGESTLDIFTSMGVLK